MSITSNRCCQKLRSPKIIAELFAKTSARTKRLKFACSQSNGRILLADQFVVNIIVEDHPLAGAGAFEVLAEINAGIAGPADGLVPDSAHKFLQLFLLPGAVTGIRGGQDFPDEIVEAVNLRRRSPADGMQDGDSLGNGDGSDAMVFVGLGVRFAPAVTGRLFVSTADKGKIGVLGCFSLAAQPPPCGFRGRP